MALSDTLKRDLPTFVKIVALRYLTHKYAKPAKLPIGFLKRSLNIIFTLSDRI
ncbi:hypothetical protein [Nostoc sp.]|uniref:hypothetical protein n=1 Tax=Nostoc sp. TaxID=1180 RepID=UPI002FF85DEB